MRPALSAAVSVPGELPEGGHRKSATSAHRRRARAITDFCSNPPRPTNRPSYADDGARKEAMTEPEPLPPLPQDFTLFLVWRLCRDRVWRPAFVSLSARRASDRATELRAYTRVVVVCSVHDALPLLGALLPTEAPLPIAAGDRALVREGLDPAAEPKEPTP
jgi:hypothetical protein